jgi:hypothetical protein
MINDLILKKKTTEVQLMDVYNISKVKLTHCDRVMSRMMDVLNSRTAECDRNLALVASQHAHLS